MLSMSTDYAKDKGNPEPYLRLIREAGFTHVHWCHHWCTDFLYADSEIAQIKLWLDDFGLGVTDIHGTAGDEKAWMALEECRRLAGVELVANRIRMAAALGSDVVIMHIPGLGANSSPLQWDRTRRSLDALEPSARACGVRIAIENGNFDDIQRLLSVYPADYVGLCYDAGHGNVDKIGLDRLEAGLKDRLISIHLHDNDGSGDQHKLLFTGTVDWPRLARLIAASSYSKWVNLETLIGNTGITDEKVFLARAYEGGTKFAQMIEKARGR